MTRTVLAVSDTPKTRQVFVERETSKPFRVVADVDPAVYDDPDFELVITIETRDLVTGRTRGCFSRHTGQPKGKSGRWALGLMSPPVGLLTTITIEASKAAKCGVLLDEADQVAPRRTGPEHHSIAFDEHDYAETTSSATSLAVTGVAHDAGDLLVALVSVFNTAGNTMTVSDPTNGTWTVATGSPVLPDANSQGHIQYLQNASGGTVTVTCDPTGTSSDIDAVICEVSGAATSGVLDQYVEATGAGLSTNTTATVTTGTLAQANNIIFAICTHTGPTTGLTSDATFTFIAEDEDNATSQAIHTEYKLVTATTAVTATVVITGPGETGWTWGIAAAVFKEAAAGGGPTPRLLLALGVGR